MYVKDRHMVLETADEVASCFCCPTDCDLEAGTMWGAHRYHFLQTGQTFEDAYYQFGKYHEARYNIDSYGFATPALKQYWNNLQYEYSANEFVVRTWEMDEPVASGECISREEHGDPNMIAYLKALRKIVEVGISKIGWEYFFDEEKCGRCIKVTLPNGKSFKFYDIVDFDIYCEIDNAIYKEDIVRRKNDRTAIEEAEELCA